MGLGLESELPSGSSKSREREHEELPVGQNQWYHFWVDAPPIVEPIFVGIERTLLLSFHAAINIATYQSFASNLIVF